MQNCNTGGFAQPCSTICSVVAPRLSFIRKQALRRLGNGAGHGWDQWLSVAVEVADHVCSPMSWAFATATVHIVFLNSLLLTK